MISSILDASALLALLLGEPGGNRVRGMLGKCAIMTVNLSEVVAVLVRSGGTVADIHTLLDPLAIERVPFDESLAYDAAELLPATRGAGLSFGDRACLALARRRGAEAVTADKTWARLPSIPAVKIVLIR